MIQQQRDEIPERREQAVAGLTEQERELIEHIDTQAEDLQPRTRRTANSVSLFFSF